MPPRLQRSPPSRSSVHTVFFAACGKCAREQKGRWEMPARRFAPSLSSCRFSSCPRQRAHACTFVHFRPASCCLRRQTCPTRPCPSHSRSLKEAMQPWTPQRGRCSQEKGEFLLRFADSLKQFSQTRRFTVFKVDNQLLFQSGSDG